MTAYLAGGTDVVDRRRHGLLDGPLAELPDVPGEITQAGGLMIGPMASIAALAAVDGYAGLTQAAAHLATPQIRRQATVGGNLLQASRCRYYRHPHLPCTHKGDADCGSRLGEDDNAILFDSAETGCIHPHPSTLAMALMAYDAEVQVGGKRRPVAELYDTADRSRTHVLGEGDILTAIHVPQTGAEKSRYIRVAGRALAEWAIVETCIRYAVRDGKIATAQVAVGAVAPAPMRLPNVEAALVGRAPDEATFAAAAALATEGANPPVQSRGKLPILRAAVKQALVEA